MAFVQPRAIDCSKHYLHHGNIMKVSISTPPEDARQLGMPPPPLILR